jgi:transposase
MTRRLPVSPSPGPLEGYATRFDDLFRARAQREGFRRYLEGLLLPAERNKTLTALANTEPVAGAQRKEAQSLQWFLSESGWDPREVNGRRLELLFGDPTTAPSGDGVLFVDEHGDRKKWGKRTAHVGRQWLANIGKTDSGVVSVSSLLADEEAYYPLEVEPYTPAHHFGGGKNDPAFRTKLKIAHQLVERSVAEGVPFRAVVADSFYGEDRGFRRSLEELGVGYVLSLKKSHCWWHAEGTVGALWEAALSAGWEGAEKPGEWTKVMRAFRDGRVTPATEQDRAQVGELAGAVQEATGESVELAYVDRGYTGEEPAREAKERGIRLEVVRYPGAKKGFVLLPRRWVVERSFAWAARFRRLAKDYERLPETVAGLHFVAFACLMLHRAVLALGPGP